MVATRSSPMKADAPAATRRQASANDAAAACPEVRVMIAYTGAQPDPAAPATADAVDGAAANSRVADAPPLCNGAAEAPSAATSFQLPHPRTGALATFMVAGGRLLEVNVQRPAQSAWFAGQSVIGDGGLFMATPVDPVFVLLPILEAAAAQGMFRELSEVLDSAEPPALRRLRADRLAAAAGSVCDTKAVGGDTFVRLNEDKVTAWLRCKVDAAAMALQATGSGAYADVGATALQRYAAALLAEWLPPARHTALLTSLGIEVDASGAPVAETSPQQPPDLTTDRPEKRLRLDPKEIAKARAKAVKAEAKAAQVAKETRGMQKMSAFFRKPAAKAAA